MNDTRLGIAFDFDGTLVDTEVAEVDAWKTVEEIYHAIGVAETVREAIVFGPQHHAPELALEVAIRSGQPHHVVYDTYRRALYNHPIVSEKRVRPVAIDLLQACIRKNSSRVLCSGAPYGWIGPFLRDLNLREMFDEVITRDTWPPNYGKADIYADLKSRLQKSGCTLFLAFEDSPRGISDAFEGGWTPIHLPNGLITEADLRRITVPIGVLENGLGYTTSELGVTLSN
ncbi:MAG: HAD family phosphatase [Armatimonadetes bacterium]|nr:HAD family phosphatase [Armatimonadota bacterium]